MAASAQDASTRGILLLRSGACILGRVPSILGPTSGGRPQIDLIPLICDLLYGWT